MNRPLFYNNHIKWIFFFTAIFVLTFASCAPRIESTSLTVYAAASLTDAFIEIGAAFEAANPNMTIAFNFGGSQNLRTQIEQGAPVDVFASANFKEMDTLIGRGLVAESAPQVFLTNSLTVILPANNPANITSLEDLGDPGVKLVLAAEEVPAGRYSRESLDKLNAQYGADFSGRVLANVVSNEDNIRQAVTKVQLGEADASIVYVSDVIAATDLKTIAIPAEFNVIAEYPIVPLTNTKNAEAAQAFIDFVLSAKGQSILEKWGFTSVNP